MGGNVAGVYAAQYPENICSLTLICPAGRQGRGSKTERGQAEASAKAQGSAGGSIGVWCKAFRNNLYLHSGNLWQGTRENHSFVLTPPEVWHLPHCTFVRVRMRANWKSSALEENGFSLGMAGILHSMSAVSLLRRGNQNCNRDGLPILAS